jgi:hypothetical protein
MQSPTKEELDCLKRIDAGLNCPQCVVDKLVAERLVERGTNVILPQLPQGFGSPRPKLTFAGQQALAAGRKGF